MGKVRNLEDCGCCGISGADLESESISAGGERENPPLSAEEELEEEHRRAGGIIIGVKPRFLLKGGRLTCAGEGRIWVVLVRVVVVRVRTHLHGLA